MTAIVVFVFSKLLGRGLYLSNNKSDILLLHIHSSCFLEIHAYSKSVAMFPKT